MIKLEDSDTWIFLSIARSDGEDMSYFYSAADHINCAIPTEQEIEGGVNRLISCGLVDYLNRGFVLTDKGRSLFDHAGGYQAFPRLQSESTKPLLQKIAAQSTYESNWKFDPTAMDKAYKQYHKRVSAIIRGMK